MPDHSPPNVPSGDDAGRPQRPRYRPPIGIPLGKQRRAGSFVLAVLLHILVILLLVVPFTSPELMSEVLGAGGAGPAGGGGGGNQGSGGANERLEFVKVAPAPQPAALPPIVRPPEEKPIIPPPPQPEKKPESTSPSNADAAQSTAPVSGTGGGTGKDGSGGTGPGSGGGTGSGIGTGKGTDVGPGTGGGDGNVYPPKPVAAFLPPANPPSRVKGAEIVVVFDVDSTGSVIDFDFSPTRDGNYNRRLRDAFSQIRFRPAVDGRGVPIRMKVSISYIIG